MINKVGARADDDEVKQALLDHHGSKSKYKSDMRILREMQVEIGDADVATLTFAVDAAIRSHADFLDNPLHMPEQMDLLGKVNSFLDAYDGLIKNSTTPRPFPIVQMGTFDFVPESML